MRLRRHARRGREAACSLAGVFGVRRVVGMGRVLVRVLGVSHALVMRVFVVSFSCGGIGDAAAMPRWPAVVGQRHRRQRLARLILGVLRDRARRDASWSCSWLVIVVVIMAMFVVMMLVTVMVMMLGIARA